MQSISSIHISKSTLQFVPLQDFTSNSDIDWSRSIGEIDAQLYEKYGLERDEIDFIERMIKPME
ncbi:MAG: type II restriction endonuclease [Prevotellaceae bacterium]|nr:type II restriction endonuclease [Prevotellaceae bacterium]